MDECLDFHKQGWLWLEYTITEIIYTSFKKGIYDLFWLYPETFRIIVSEENRWNQLNNEIKSSLHKEKSGIWSELLRAANVHSNCRLLERTAVLYKYSAIIYVLHNQHIPCLGRFIPRRGFEFLFLLPALPTFWYLKCCDVKQKYNYLYHKLKRIPKRKLSRICYFSK